MQMPLPNPRQLSCSCSCGGYLVINLLGSVFEQQRPLCFHCGVKCNAMLEEKFWLALAPPQPAPLPQGGWVCPQPAPFPQGGWVCPHTPS